MAESASSNNEGPTASTSVDDGRGVKSSQASQRSLTSQASMLVAARLFATVLSFGCGVLAARVFDPALRGEYAMLTTVAAFVMVLGNLGVGEGLIHFYNSGSANLARIATIAFATSTLVLLIGALIGAFLAPALAAAYFPSSGTSGAWLALLAGFFAILHRNGYSINIAKRDFSRAGLSASIQPALLICVLLWALWREMTIGTIALFYAVSWLLAGLYVVAPTFAFLDRTAISASFGKKFFAFASRSYVNVVFTQLNYRLDMFVVGYLDRDLSTLAFYHIAASVTSLLWLIPDSLGQAVFPRLSSAQSELERTELTVSAIRHAVVVVALGAVAIGSMAPIVIPLVFGREYEQSVPAILVLLPGVVAIAIVKILMRFMMSIERHGWSIVWSVVGTVVCVIGDVVLVPQSGALGAAAASTIAYLVTAVGMIALFFIIARPGMHHLREFPGREIRHYWSLAHSLIFRRG